MNRVCAKARILQGFSTQRWKISPEWIFCLDVKKKLEFSLANQLQEDYLS